MMKHLTLFTVKSEEVSVAGAMDYLSLGDTTPVRGYGDPEVVIHKTDIPVKRFCWTDIHGNTLTKYVCIHPEVEKIVGLKFQDDLNACKKQIRKLKQDDEESASIIRNFNGSNVIKRIWVAMRGTLGEVAGA
jgi:hypothetical protein